VVEHAVTDTTVNSGGAGDRTGNLLTFHNKVFNAKDTKQVGRDQGFCVRIVPGASYECMWTTFISGGQITVEGPFLDTANSVLAITGGTGPLPRRSRRDESDLAQRRQRIRLHLPPDRLAPMLPAARGRCSRAGRAAQAAIRSPPASGTVACTRLENSITPSSIRLRRSVSTSST